MRRNQWIAIAAVIVAVLYLAYVFLVTGGPERAPDLPTPVAGSRDASEPGD